MAKLTVAFNAWHSLIFYELCFAEGENSSDETPLDDSDKYNITTPEFHSDLRYAYRFWPLSTDEISSISKFRRAVSMPICEKI